MDTKEAVAYLRSPVAIRAQCQRLYDLAEANELAHFRLRQDALPAVARFVTEVTREAYPTLAIPYHSRWRHFDAARTAALAALLADCPPDEATRSRVELAIVSVLLDAGAGARWSYKDPRDGRKVTRSEGLALASFDMFLAGAFSSDPAAPLRADVDGLRRVDAAGLAQGFQVSTANPLLGLDGRVALLNKLATALTARPKIFGTTAPRLGGLVDYLRLQAEGGRLPARKILSAVLEGLGDIWPGRVALGGVNLGDVWRHPQLPLNDPGRGLVPFHKLSQWLTYSLCEPLEALGLTITGLDELTGLPEYRNGGLYLDRGVLEPRRAEILTETHTPDSPVIVEWRALTVILLDRTADLVRAELGLSAAALPLAKVLQGGTWTAGRRIAATLRADGGSPLHYVSDGTLF
jgi:hypothetical protein